MAIATNVRTEETTRDAIVGRIENRDTDILVPEHAMKQIDRVMEEMSEFAWLLFPGTDDGARYGRVHYYYQEYLDRIDPGTHEEATVFFDEYMACLIKNAQTTVYRHGVDSLGNVVVEPIAA